MSLKTVNLEEVQVLVLEEIQNTIEIDKNQKHLILSREIENLKLAVEGSKNIQI